ncbi:gliding motility-associated C-terminal domain-containing protein [Flavobacterium enshiense]|uniref:T9SS type B sorting domain-containing protein n=1 Tax=Flavobacterium enshiense TaxID=1341165 RepID=UPI00345DA1CC
MNTKLLNACCFLLLLLSGTISAQDVSLYNQFAGRYDYTFIGNTLNPEENSFQFAPTIFTSSSANLNLSTGNTIEAAYLYWAGSGTGDLDILVNGQAITAERTFSHQRVFGSLVLDYFSAFTNITSLVQATGNGTYTISELDVSPFISDHFIRRTNFAGWAIVIIYRNDALPLNQLNIYDGLQTVPNEILITLDNLNVIDNEDAKIGFLAWEGDSNIAVNESLFINTNLISDPPLNPFDNAFNGTNSILNTGNLYNMDLDIYNVQDNIDIGDTEATIRLTSGQDFVMINAIVTKFNSQLPDATVTIDNFSQQCNVRELLLDYTVYNINSTDPLPAGTQIGIYANGELIATNQTPAVLQIGESVSLSQTVTIPGGIPLNFTLTVMADYNGAVTELNENNNTDNQEITLWVSPAFNQPGDLTGCNLGLGSAYFDFSSYEESIKTDPSQTVTFHETLEDAQLDQNAIVSIFHYYAAITPHQIFVRIENDNCYSITSFMLLVRNCPPIVYNAVSANGDGLNDTFFIEGLRDIFVNFELYIYNRWGRHIWTGNNSVGDWDGYVKDGVGSTQAPDGTYFYVLKLNDPDYPDAMTGYLYLNH